jgi:hypothetical protein
MRLPGACWFASISRSGSGTDQEPSRCPRGVLTAGASRALFSISSRFGPDDEEPSLFRRGVVGGTEGGNQGLCASFFRVGGWWKRR